MNNRAVRYLRVSTEHQDENNQIKAIDKFCKEKGWKIVRTYRDHGKSAWKNDLRREEYQNMLKDAKKDMFEHIVVFDLDRFSRQPEQDVLDLVKNLRLMYGVEVNAVYGDEWRDVVNMINKIPDMGFMAKAMAEMLEVIIVGFQAQRARKESEKISRRVKSSKKFQKAIDKGKVGRPGISEEVKQQVIKLLNEGKSYSYISKHITYKAKYGKVKHISAPTISEIKKSSLGKGSSKIIQEKISNIST